MIDIFKILGLEISGWLKSAEPHGHYGPGMWSVKQKDNGIDQNTLHYCYSHLNALDKGGKVGTIFMNLSKVFHTLDPNLLLWLYLPCHKIGSNIFVGKISEG